MTKKKTILGQFFTVKTNWLKKHIEEFINESQCSIAYDPFAGAGHLLDVVKNLDTIKQTRGLDIDTTLNWEYNDSLKNIPTIENAIIITNPPYLSKYSASRKKIDKNLKEYFSNSIYDDIYLIALDKLLEAQDFVVAIIPETFINSSYKQKARLVSITILEENPFEDTETPVLVACFDGRIKPLSEIKVYKNDTFINDLKTIEDMRLVPKKSIDMKFNDRDGWLAVRCVDTTNPKDMLRFDFKENIEYDWKNRIKTSSRAITLINIDIPENKKQPFIDFCNELLTNVRQKSEDIIFSPFKCNMDNGKRRRRLDFYTCRAIIEQSYNSIIKNNKGEVNE